ncbi:MAG: hypothetical protein AAGD06_03075 [Acidobacteriota bacterium]
MAKADVATHGGRSPVAARSAAPRASRARTARGRRRRAEAVWRRAALAVGVLCVAAYAVGAWLPVRGLEPRPGSHLGVAWGIGAALLLLTTVLYGARRRAMATSSKLRLGTSRSWLRLHLYGGGLFLLLLLLHSGFKLPAGGLSWWLWGLSLWVVVTGAAGLALQRWLPRVLSSGLAGEVHYDRIPELVTQLHRRAESLAASSPEPVRRFYARTLSPVLGEPRWNPVYFLDVGGGARRRLERLRRLYPLLPPAEQPKLTELEDLVRTKLEIDVQYTLQSALRGWLWVHVPASLALVVLVALHIFAVIYY